MAVTEQGQVSQYGQIVFDDQTYRWHDEASQLVIRKRTRIQTRGNVLACWIGE